jgi:hypothetical protein
VFYSVLSDRSIRSLFLFAAILASPSWSLAISQKVGLGVNLGLPNLLGVDVHYLLTGLHQLHFSYPLYRAGSVYGIVREMSIGYTYRPGGEGAQTFYGGQLRYWRFDPKHSALHSLFELMTLGLLRAEETDPLDVVFLGPQFGVEKRRGRSVLSFSVEMLGPIAFTKFGTAEGISLRYNQAFYFPYLRLKYAYHF